MRELFRKLRTELSDQFEESQRIDRIISRDINGLEVVVHQLTLG